METVFADFQEKDYEEVKNMIFSLYIEDSDSEVMNEMKISNTFSTLKNNPQKGKIIIFKRNDQIIGYAILAFCWNTEYGGDIAMIEDLYVKPPWRNQGISTRFVQYLVERYLDKVVALKLEVSPSNKNAQAFYEKKGFVHVHSLQMIKKCEV